MSERLRRIGTFGARPCRSIRRRLFAGGAESLPRGWRRHSWIIARIRATPEWADFGPIKALYAEAQRLTDETGVRHVVDHIIPLQAHFASGLHVAANLQVVRYAVNAFKSNKFNPTQEELAL